VRKQRTAVGGVIGTDRDPDAGAERLIEFAFLA
jgi:hypothetical protein